MFTKMIEFFLFYNAINKNALFIDRLCVVHSILEHIAISCAIRKVYEIKIVVFLGKLD